MSVIGLIIEILRERKISLLTIFEFLPISDIETIKNLTRNYLKYVRNKRRESYEIKDQARRLQRLRWFILIYSNGGLIEEIEVNLKQCSDDKERNRYIVSLINPFRDFADLLEPSTKCCGNHILKDLKEVVFAAQKNSE